MANPIPAASHNAKHHATLAVVHPRWAMACRGPEAWVSANGAENEISVAGKRADGGGVKVEAERWGAMQVVN